MKLRHFLYKNGITMVHFARYCKVPYATMWAYVNETRTVRLDYAMKIVKASKKKVTLKDMNYHVGKYKRITKKTPEEILGKQPNLD